MKGKPSGTGRVRCAIYTRKSTEEGLEQEFNSLDAQREACAAYVLSQRHEGWTQVPEVYDDGGYSGGNMERPSLKRLLADIEAGNIDVIVVYKVDRLTRSLADFARIVDVLDARDASFVSVTQAFNTTTSMGRLTLNVLLSFAQFEREVTGERIRDKIAASKKKGMWMGGPVPLGYEVRNRKLIVNDKEAALVRHLFSRYAALGCGQKLAEDLRADGYRTKLRPQRDGRTLGGIPFGRGMLLQLLSNRIYVGEVVHKGTAHPGEHEGIIDQPLWDEVQSQLEVNRIEKREGTRSPNVSLLAGIIYDGLGRRMTPSHTSRGKVRYHYYITHDSQVQQGDPPAWRLPANDLEAVVIERLRQLFVDRHAIRGLIDIEQCNANDLARALEAGGKTAASLALATARRPLVINLVSRVIVEEDQILITLDPDLLSRRLGISSKAMMHLPELIAPAAKIRRGNETRLVITDQRDAVPARDDKLIALLLEAQAARDLFLDNPALTIAAHARANGQCRKRLVRLVRLSWLAPDIIRAIAEGRQPQQLNVKALLASDLPPRWPDQARQLGIA